MDFQDSLKSSFKTKEEVNDQKSLEERKQDISFVVGCVRDIEKALLEQASRGEYKIVDGEEVVKSLFHIQNSLNYLNRVSSYVYDRLGRITEEKIKVKFNDRYFFLIDELKERLAEDEIYITKQSLARYVTPSSSHTGCAVPISKCSELEYPAIFRGVKGSRLMALQAKDLKIVIECRVTVPTEYSEEFKATEQALAQMGNEEHVEEDGGTSQSPVFDFDKMDGHQFENFCAELLSKNGFVNVEQTKGSGDQGVDIIAYKDGVKFGIQCKCYSSDVGNKAVQEVFTGKSYYHCNVAAILTSSHFTQYAKELAQMNNVVLWDREKLLEFIGNAKI